MVSLRRLPPPGAGEASCVHLFSPCPRGLIRCSTFRYLCKHVDVSPNDFFHDAITIHVAHGGGDPPRPPQPPSTTGRTRTSSRSTPRGPLTGALETVRVAVWAVAALGPQGTSPPGLLAAQAAGSAARAGTARYGVGGVRRPCVLCVILLPRSVLLLKIDVSNSESL